MQKALTQNAQMLHKELPVRLARRINELQKMPYGLSEMAPVQKVRGWYVRSFNDLISMREPQTMEEEQAFTACLEKILKRHSSVVPTMAQGIMMLKEQMGDDAVRKCPFLQDFLDRFYLSRIGVRMLLSQHVALHEPAEGFIGILGESVCPGDEAEAAVAHATHVCEARYGCCPTVEIRGDVKERIPYVPGHLHHMLHELLKNAMRAVVETHAPHLRPNGYHHSAEDASDGLPPIDITIAAGQSDFHIRIADQGGGIPRSQIANIWNYMYTTAERPKEQDLEIKGGIRNAPMAGFGYGLPLSKLYARYFGGDIDIVSMDGYGTHAYLYLSRIGNTKEPLPN
uniref:Protein-serine/threonine kinase n=1 Tax=Lotharella oceanica TaxID=641309 RepID=A0A7S2TF55_9EUKA